MPKLIRITTVPVSLDLLLTEQMKYMGSNGLEVYMVSANDKRIPYLVEREACPHIIVPFTRSISPFKDLKCLCLLIKIFLKEKPDIVHTHTPKAGLLGMLAAKICGVKVKIHTIAGLPLMTASGSKRRLLEYTEKATYWAADFVLPNSKSIMAFVKENNFTKASKLDMIGGGSSNGIKLKRFSRASIQKKTLEEIKAKIDYNPKNRYILSVGRVVKDKGIIELVEAFSKVNKTSPNLKLIVVGPLEEQRKEEMLPKYITEALVEHQDIIHINWSNEVEYYMYLADIFIHASYREGFPNVLLQSGAMECPIICSDIHGNIDIVTNRNTGLYFEVGKVDDLAQQLIYALNCYEEVSVYAKRLRKEIELCYSQSKIHYELLQFYLSKLNTRSNNKKISQKNK